MFTAPSAMTRAAWGAVIDSLKESGAITTRMVASRARRPPQPLAAATAWTNS